MLVPMCMHCVMACHPQPFVSSCAVLCSERTIVASWSASRLRSKVSRGSVRHAATSPGARPSSASPAAGDNRPRESASGSAKRRPPQSLARVLGRAVPQFLPTPYLRHHDHARCALRCGDPRGHLWYRVVPLPSQHKQPQTLPLDLLGPTEEETSGVETCGPRTSRRALGEQPDISRLGSHSSGIRCRCSYPPSHGAGLLVDQWSHRGEIGKGCCLHGCRRSGGGGGGRFA